MKSGILIKKQYVIHYFFSLSHILASQTSSGAWNNYNYGAAIVKNNFIFQLEKQRTQNKNIFGGRKTKIITVDYFNSQQKYIYDLLQPPNYTCVL